MTSDRARARRARRPRLGGLIALTLLGLVIHGACGAPAAVPEVSIAPDPLSIGNDDDGRMLMRSPVITHPVHPGFALPYPIDRIYGTFGDCRDRGRRQHRGLDLGGVGENFGLGTPVRSMARAEIVLIGRGADDPARFGRPDTRTGTVERRGHALPRSATLPVYGTVYFFSRDYGSWRSGDIISTVVIGGPLDGHRIRYMHLAAIHPELQVGDHVEAGQEIGLMGGTAVMNDLPHIHIDIETPNGVRVDPAPFLGMEADTRTCGRQR